MKTIALVAKTLLWEGAFALWFMFLGGLLGVTWAVVTSGRCAAVHFAPPRIEWDRCGSNSAPLVLLPAERAAQ